MSGWIPVYDTMHGIRGEVNVIVKVDYFSDVNKFRQSSCGVHFFHCKSCHTHIRLIHFVDSSFRSLSPLSSGFTFIVFRHRQHR